MTSLGPSQEQAAVELDGVGLLSTEGAAILDGITWSVGPGSVCAVIGPSGSGKTRLVRLFNRLDEPSSGKVRVLGRDIREWHPRELRRAVGFVSQSPVLSEGTIRDNLHVPVDLGAVTQAEFGERFDGALAVAGVDKELLSRPLTKVSGGQKHRVAIARALIVEPTILILDEPTGSLDGAGARAMLEGLLEWRVSRQSTLIVVTHRLSDVRTLGGQLLALAEGRVVMSGPVSEILDSERGDTVRAIMSGDMEVAS